LQINYKFIKWVNSNVNFYTKNAVNDDKAAIILKYIGNELKHHPGNRCLKTEQCVTQVRKGSSVYISVLFLTLTTGSIKMLQTFAWKRLNVRPTTRKLALKSHWLCKVLVVLFLSLALATSLHSWHLSRRFATVELLTIVGVARIWFALII
jgi:hypothetical protein